MAHTPIQRLELLREIAETINGAYEMEPMLDAVLQALLKLTELQAGWIFLAKPGAMYYDFAADAMLPPALEIDGKRPMKVGTCWCLDRFRDGRLHHAVNILNCKRLEDAVRFKWGDTRGISHHASIPLRSGEELFGIMNVASPGKTFFSEEELALLQSIAYQIGTASHRIRLYRMEQKRADLFSRLGLVSRQISTLQDSRGLDAGIVRITGEQMGWRHVAIFVKESQVISRRALYGDGQLDERITPYRAEALRELPERLEDVLWRIGQEALNNVSKHAGTDAALIELTYTEWEASMAVSDNGKGIPTDKRKASLGYGMTTMRERAEAVGGTVSVRSRAGKGTQVTVRLPL